MKMDDDLPQWFLDLFMYFMAISLVVGLFYPIYITLAGADSTKDEMRSLLEQVGPLTLGMKQSDVWRQAGRPDAVCEGEDGWGLDSYLTDSLFQQKDVTRWIYYFGDAERTAALCRPQYRDTVLGFSEDGRLLWYIRFLGESDFISEIQDDPGELISSGYCCQFPVKEA